MQRRSRADLHVAAERARDGARAALVVALLAIAWLAFLPDPESVPGLGWDKLNHVAAFVVLAALAALGWPDRHTLPWRLGLLMGYGLGIELAQAWLFDREGSAWDLAADALGLALWSLVARMGAAWRRRRGAAVSPAVANACRSVPTDSRGSPGE
jgi:VanZ family protein